MAELHIIIISTYNQCKTAVSKRKELLLLRGSLSLGLKKRVAKVLLYGMRYIYFISPCGSNSKNIKAEKNTNTQKQKNRDMEL